VRYTRYREDIEHAMKTFVASLSEHDRRAYAAVEALKLGHGGIGYIADLLGCSERTVRRGLAELQNPPPKLPLGKSRKKGVAANAASTV
jgi:transcriptional antiterminator